MQSSNYDLDTGTFFGEDTLDREFERADPSPSRLTAADAPQRQGEGEDVVTRYFGDVRNFTLLNREQEQVLWQRIERLKHRGRRVLLTSPTAMATLTRLWNQVKHRELSLAQLMEIDASEDDRASEAAFGDAVAAWATPRQCEVAPGALAALWRMV